MKCSQSFTELIRIANNIISTIRISAQFLDEQEGKHSHFQKLRSTDSQLASKLLLLWQRRGLLIFLDFSSVSLVMMSFGTKSILFLYVV